MEQVQRKPCGETRGCRLRSYALGCAHSSWTYLPHTDAMIERMNALEQRYIEQYGCDKCPEFERWREGVLDYCNQ